MPSTTLTLLKFHKPPLSLKQFMLRSEILKLYRGFMRLGRLMEPPPPTSATPPLNPTSPPGPSCSTSTPPHPSSTKKFSRNHPMQLEWIDWVRSEFRLRQETTDEEVIRMMLTQGKRQLQEMERTILLATNRNLNTNTSSVTSHSSSSCSKRKEKDA